ncbi:shikimate dehydrogenase [Thiohalorhabdus methylotrophus]|uniref:Shikimate dehydrogenase (NADP(+)) n=1 Tax=Thiohalorhabdus methylotrophus TaxID=3242694 RepID=A0ABV4TPV5_9GAMM
MSIRGSTRVLGVFGDPVAHSLSPAMHTRFAEESGEDSVYVPFHVLPENLETALHALPSLGIRGVNITVPHKESTFRLVSEHTDAARAMGAVNTVIVDGERLIGDNTDGAGFAADLEAHFDHTGWGKGPVVVLGAGGAARAVVHALTVAGVPEVVVANRTLETGQALIGQLAPETGRAVALPSEELQNALPRARLLVNTTSVGLKGETFPGLSLDALPREAGVYDLIYNPARTPLLQEAEQQGLAVANGLGMLVRQGAISYARWTGKEPRVEPVIEWLEGQLGN